MLKEEVAIGIGVFLAILVCLGMILFFHRRHRWKQKDTLPRDTRPIVELEANSLRAELASKFVVMENDHID